MANVYYHLFLLHSIRGEEVTAQHYVNLLKEKFPDSQWTTLLTDPYFKENAALGVHMEDSLYAATYDAFKAGSYATVKANAKLSEKRFPIGANRDKFMFINSLTTLNEGDAEGCVNGLKQMLTAYPQSGLAEMAGMIVRGVGEGRRLRGGTFDIGNVWEQRTVTLNATDSTAVKALSAERNTDFLFIIAYPTDSVDENRLLFELAKYNFTSYMVRNFDIAIEDNGALHAMQISGFRNYDEALQYARQLYAGSRVMQIAAKGRGIIISAQNLPMLGRQFSYDDYDNFYAKHFAPLKVSTLPLLNEPFISPDEQEYTTPQRRGTEDANTPADNDGTTIAPFEEEKQEDNGTTVVPLEEETKKDDATTVVPLEEETQKDDATTVVPLEEEKKGDDNNGATIVPIEEEKTQQPAPTAAPTQPVKTEKSAPSSQPAATEKPKPTLEDDFYFDDSNAPAATNGGNKKREDKADLEDEYYDLDGF